MRATLALVRAGWLTAASYRVGMLFSLLSLLVMIVPVYLVAEALQPVMAEAIRTEGDRYFPFLLVGMIVFSFLTAAVTALPGVVQGGLSNGTLEALLATPARLPSILAGLVGYRFAWTAVRTLLLLAAGIALGARFAWWQALPGLVILGLIVLAHLPFGAVAAAMVLAFRTTGPLPQAVLVASGLLGGVYYPTQVIPDWIERLSALLPLTYGLRALRRTVLEGAPLTAVGGDVLVLLGFVVLLWLAAAWLLATALRYARRTGTLAQY